MIWGMTLHPGEEFTRKVLCDEHLTLASLECRADKCLGEGRPSACLLLKTGRGQHVLCTLEEGVVNQQCLDLILEQGEKITFLVEGTGIVYLTGYSSRKRHRELSWPIRESEGSNTGFDDSFQGETQSVVDREVYDDDDDMTQEVSGNHGDDEEHHDDDGDNITADGDSGLSGAVQGGSNDPNDISGDYHVESIALDYNNHTGSAVKFIQGVGGDIIVEGNADPENRNRQGIDIDGQDSENLDQGINVVVEKITERAGGENVNVSQRRSNVSFRDISPKFDSISQVGDRSSLTKTRSYRCFICLESFGKKADCTAHEKICNKGTQWKHRDREPYRCRCCGKAFDRPSKMLIHEKIHFKETNFECRFCKKKFASPYTLKRHESIHTKESRIKCLLCPKTYMAKSHLVEHMRSHTGEKPFQCDLCQTFFSTVSAHNRHMRRHQEGFSFCCETCGRGFSSQKKLAAHTKIHTDQPKYKCRYCDMAFVMYYHRQRHERSIHSA